MLKTSIATTEPWCLGHTVHASLTTGGSFQEVRITIGTFQHVQHDVKAELFLLTRKQIGHKFHSHFVHAQIIAWAEPSLTPISLEISWTVSWWPSMIKLRTFSMTSGFQLIRYCPTGMLVTLNWCSAIFKTGIPLFYLCNTHSIVAKSLLNLADCFALSVAQAFGKIWCSGMVQRIPSLRTKLKCDEHVLQKHTYWLPGSEWLTVKGYKKSRVYTKVCPTTLQEKKIRSDTFWTDLKYIYYIIYQIIYCDDTFIQDLFCLVKEIGVRVLCCCVMYHLPFSFGDSSVADVGAEWDAMCKMSHCVAQY